MMLDWKLMFIFAVMFTKNLGWKKWALIGLFISTSFSAFSQQLNSSEIYREIEKLNQFGSVLYVAAHPDDENTRVISYLSKGCHYRVGYLSLTRGDGGQNLIGSEQGEELGLIRTHELIEARKIDGAEQFFSRAYDFGYSKTPEETFAIWNKEEVLRDVVWVIRKFRPDVIISRFPTTGEGGHGHHTASAILAKEAFAAAADPSRFPEQLNKVSVWQASRIVWNTFSFGDRNTTAPDQFQLDVGTFEPMLGKSYGEIASMSRSKHSSQGFGTPLNRKAILEYFKIWEGTEPKHSLMEGVDTGWNKCINDPKKALGFQKQVQDILAKYNPKNPSASIEALVTLRKELMGYTAAFNPEFSYWTEIKLKLLNNILLQCAGIHCEITTDKQNLVPGDTVKLKLSIIARLLLSDGFTVDFSMSSFKLSKSIVGKHWDTSFSFVLPQFNNQTGGSSLSELAKASSSSPIDFDISQPYWLRKVKSKGLFADPGLSYLGLAENPNLFFASFRLHFAKPDFSVFVEPHWQYKFTDPSVGEVHQPVFVVPPAVIIPTLEKNYFLLPYIYDNRIDTRVSLHFKVKSHVNNFKGKLKLELPESWIIVTSYPANEIEVEIEKMGGEKNIEIQIRSTTNFSHATAYKQTVKYYIEHDNKVYNRSEKRINYPHIPNLLLLPEAQSELVLVPISKETVNKAGKIGYLSGSGDKVFDCLKSVGFAIYEISETELNNPQLLSEYRTIITGIRAYNTRNDLQAKHPNLMEYVKNGGRLVVQYNTNNRLGPLGFDIGPYPITISRDRVTDEEAEVNFLQPSHKLFSEPHPISKNDFSDWVQERGVYFVGKRDEKYVSILSMADPNEDVLDGSLVYAEYGNGSFIYTGLSFFRQLPAGNSGAYRLFINLIYNPLAIPDVPEKTSKKKKKNKDKK